MVDRLRVEDERGRAQAGRAVVVLPVPGLSVRPCQPGVRRCRAEPVAGQLEPGDALPVRRQPGDRRVRSRAGHRLGLAGHGTARRGLHVPRPRLRHVRVRGPGARGMRRSAFASTRTSRQKRPFRARPRSGCDSRGHV